MNRLSVSIVLLALSLLASVALLLLPEFNRPSRAEIGAAQQCGGKATP